MNFISWHKIITPLLSWTSEGNNNFFSIYKNVYRNTRFYFNFNTTKINKSRPILLKRMLFSFKKWTEDFQSEAFTNLLTLRSQLRYCVCSRLNISLRIACDENAFSIAPLQRRSQLNAALFGIFTYYSKYYVLLEHNETLSNVF